MSMSSARFRQPNETDGQFRQRLKQLDTKPNPKKQRFGVVKNTLGGWAELRRQKKAPHKEILYIPSTPTYGETNWCALNHLPTDILERYMREIGTALQEKIITQENAELILDLCYAELGRRVK